MSMVWPTLVSRTVKEQNRTEPVVLSLAAANLSCLILFCDVIEHSSDVSLQQSVQTQLQDLYMPMVLA